MVIVNTPDHSDADADGDKSQEAVDEMLSEGDVDVGGTEEDEEDEE